MVKKMRERFKYVAVVLVYRNINDLIEAIDSYKEHIPSCKIIVVNAYYDEGSMNQIKEVALNESCDFINIENKGYSFGNNTGISYANENYEYDFIIVSNPDITIGKFDDSVLDIEKIYAPMIISKSGKNQNPMVIRKNKVAEYFVYLGMKKNSKLITILGLLIGKISRWTFECLHKDISTIYQAHGSFVILGKKVIEKLHPIYDENMFLFAEEGVLAFKSAQMNIETVYTNNIKIYHKEDGSMSLGDFKISDELKKANIYYYEKYVMKK